nr:MAG TPA: hypothetical protein [Caudoviricetes sp.]
MDHTFVCFLHPQRLFWCYTEPEIFRNPQRFLVLPIRHQASYHITLTNQSASLLLIPFGKFFIFILTLYRLVSIGYALFLGVTYELFTAYILPFGKLNCQCPRFAPVTAPWFHSIVQSHQSQR